MVLLTLTCLLKFTLFVALVTNQIQRFGQKPYETRIDVYETLCPQQMLVHKGGKIKNWGGECRDVTPTKSLSQNIRVDENREVKFFFFFFFFFFGGGGGGGVGLGGVRVDVNEELKYLRKFKKKKNWGGGGVGLGGQDGCEQ